MRLVGRKIKGKKRIEMCEKKKYIKRQKYSKYWNLNEVSKKLRLTMV